MSDKIGMKVVVSQGALNHFKDKLLPVAEARAMSAHIGDMESQTRQGLLGRVKVEIHDFVFTYFHVSNASIELVPPNILVINFDGLNIKMEMRWRYNIRRIHTSDHGRGEGYTWGSRGRVAFGIGNDPQGRPTAWINDCWVDIRDFHLRVHSSASWLYNAIISMFNNQIVRSIEGAVRHTINNDVPVMLNNMFSRIPVQEHIGNDYAIDYSLAQSGGIFITPEHQLVAQSSGEFYPQNEAPGQSPWFTVWTPNNENGSMFQIFISKCSIQSLGFAAVRSHRLQKDLTKDSTKKGQGFFKTKFFDFYVPGFVRKYGPDRDVTLHLEMKEPPTVEINKKDKLIVHGNIEMEVRVQNDNGQVERPFTVLLKTTCVGSVKVIGTTISGQLTELKASSEMVQSQVGGVDLGGLDSLLHGALTLGIEAVNKKLAKGAPLPSIRGIQYCNPQVHYRDGFIVVTTDINYTPSV